LEISFGRNEIVAAMDQCVGVKPEYASKSSAISLDVSCLSQRVNTNYLMPVEDQKLQGIISLSFFFTKLEGCEPLQEFIEAHKNRGSVQEIKKQRKKWKKQA
jgi:hypothetical protein